MKITDVHEGSGVDSNVNSAGEFSIGQTLKNLKAK
jgi:hypothetical protein